MSSSKKRLTVIILAALYFGLFSLLDGIIALNAYFYAFLIFLSGFEYVGIERLFCTPSGERSASFKETEFFCYAVMIPLLAYSLCAAGSLRLGNISFECSAAVALGTAIYRGIFYIIETIFDI